MNLFMFFCYLIAPLPVLLVIGRIRILSRRKRETTAEVSPTPFEPEPMLADGRFLRRFTPVQRVYLRQQIPAARIGFAVVVWLVFSLLAPSVFPTSVHRYELIVPQAQRVWCSFLLSATRMPWFTTFIAIFTAVFAASGLGGSRHHTAFNRTRPLERRFIFWGRVLSALFALVFGYIAGIMLASGAIVAVYGPVWRHLDLSLQLQVVKSWDRMLSVWLLLSPWKLFVAIGADMMFVFGITMLFLLQPLRFKNAPKVLVSLWAGFCCFAVFSVTGFFEANKVMGLSNILPVLSRFGFITEASGTPPPMTTYLIPLAVSAIMLWLAQLAAARKED